MTLRCQTLNAGQKYRNDGSPCNHWARCQVVRRGRQRRMRVLRRNLKLCCHGRREICLYIFARAWSCQLCPSWEQRIRAVCVWSNSPGSQRERETPNFRQWTHSASSRHLAALASSPKLHSSSYAHLRQSCAQRSFVASNLSVLSGTHQHKGSARSALQKWSAATLRLLLLTQMEPNKKWPAVPPGTCGGHQYMPCRAACQGQRDALRRRPRASVRAQRLAVSAAQRRQ